MAEEFDPYHKWFGIPPNEQPPNHYRLLGVELFEADPEVIDIAADQRMLHLKTYQNGSNARASQDLLTEVAKARICLSNETTKQDYDRSLRLKLTLRDSDPNSPPPIPSSISSPSAPTDAKKTEFDTAIDSSTLNSGAMAFHQIKSRNKKLLFAVVGLFFCLIAVIGYTTLKPNNEADRVGGSSRVASGTSDSDQLVSKDQTAKRNQGNDLSEAKPAEENGNVSDQTSETQTDEASKPKTQKNSTETSKSGSGTNSSTDAEPDSAKLTNLIAKSPKPPQSTTGLSRHPVPNESIWKPFLSVLRREFEIEDDLNNQQREVLFNELLNFSKLESRPGRSFAMFQLALEQAAITANTSGSSVYQLEINKPFIYEHARRDFLLAVATGIDNKLKLAVWLEAVSDLASDYTKKSDWSSATLLLEKVTDVISDPIGRSINDQYFKSWLAATKHLAKISNQFEQENKTKLIEGQLSEEQQVDAGTYFYFAKRDLPSGLSHYEKSGFKPLVDLAKLSKKNPSAPMELVSTADKWFNISSKVGDAEFLFREQAKENYDRYKRMVPADQLSKKVLKRIGELTPEIDDAVNSMPRSISRMKFSSRWNELNVTTNILGQIQIDAISESSISISGKDGFELFDLKSGRLLNSNLASRKLFHPIQAFRSTDESSLLAILEPRRGVRIIDIDQRLGKKKQSPFRRLFSDSTTRAFDIGSDFTVYAVTLNDIKQWTPAQAWQTNSPAEPRSFPIPSGFIPNRIVAMAEMGYALSDDRNLARIPASQKAIEIYSGEALYDYDFSTNGSAVVLATKGSIHVRTLKSNSKRTIKTQPDAKKIKFFDGARFAISLHEDGSLRAWDTKEKSENYQLDALQFINYKPVDFAISSDRRSVILIDETAAIRIIKLFMD